MTEYQPLITSRGEEFGGLPEEVIKKSYFIPGLVLT